MSIPALNRGLVGFVVCGFLPTLACAPGNESVAEGGLASVLSQDPTAEPQTMSLFGEPLFAVEDTSGVVEEADAALARAPDDVELLIAAGRVRRNFQQYRQALALYTRALELAPNDWRPYRYRGHRHISLRAFDAAIQDLEAARELAPLNWDVAYHLGLAYFLAGRFVDASDEYQRCLGLSEDEGAAAAQAADFRSCSQNGADPGSRVAMTEWAVRAALRSGREALASELLAGIPEDLEIGANLPYYHDLLFYKGMKTADELLAPDSPYRLETVGYGVANWYLAQGDTTTAVELLEEVAGHPHWAGFGRIAAEAELVRLGGG